MRNLKKFLALVLAMMMVFSLMVTVNAAAPSGVSANYAEAVDILMQLGIFKGRDGGNFAPDQVLRRDEVSTLVYRVITGDVTDAQKDIYKDYGKFSDVPENYWAAGYINYAANGKYVVGDGLGKFHPDTQINGYQLLAILLRAIGYGRNGEYAGTGWEIRTATDARELGITKGITEGTLGKGVTREVVAQIIYNALSVPLVNYTVARNYYQDHDGKSLITLVPSPSTDDWGAPSVKYAATWNKVVGHTGSANIANKPLDEFWGPKTECDVAAAIKLTGSKTYNTVYTDGNKGIRTTKSQNEIVATDIVGTIGQNGRWTRIYNDRIVYVDTFLAKVTKVTAAVYDEASHVIRPASAEATIYSNTTATVTNATVSNITVEGSYNMDDILAVTVLTDVDSTGKDLKLTSNVEIVDAAKITPFTVTVAGIGKNTSASNNEMNFKDANGKTYQYNYTFGYNETGAKNASNGNRLTDAAIGSDILVYADAHGYVLGLDVAPASDDYGVITGVDTFQIEKGKYAVEYDILTTSGALVLRAAKSDGTFWATQSAADKSIKDQSDGVVQAKNLVKYTIDLKNPGYYTVSKVGRIDTTSTAVWAGRAEAISSTYLSTNKTVYFVADYTLSNNSSDYKSGSYTVYNGFKDIPDLGYNTGDKIDGGSGLPSSGGMTVQYFTGTDETLGSTVTYVLILNATEKKSNAVEIVPDYAYLPNPGEFVTDYQTYMEYNAYYSGSAGTLRVAYNATTKPAQSGLYTYANSNNGAYREIKVTPFSANGSAYDYSEGVLRLDSPVTYTGAKADGKGLDRGTTGASGANTTVTNKNYFTVADNAALYVVNMTKGTVSPAQYDIDTLLDDSVYGGCKIWFQLNEYGYINVIYIEAKEKSAAPATPITDIDIAAGKPKAGSELGPVKVSKVNGNAALAGKVSITYKWYDTTAGKYVTNDTIADKGHVYTLIVSVTAAARFELSSSCTVTGDATNGEIPDANTFTKQPSGTWNYTFAAT